MKRVHSSQYQLPHLVHHGFSARLKIWQVSSCKMGYKVALLSVRASQPHSQPAAYFESLRILKNVSSNTNWIILKFKFDCRWLNPVGQMIEKRMARWIILNFKFYCRWLNPIWQIIEKKMSRNFWPKHILTKTFSKQNYFPMKNFFLPNFFSGQTFLQTKFIFRPKILSDRNVFRKKLFRPIFYLDENFYRPEFFQTKNDFRLKNNSNRKKEEKKK